MWQRIKCLFGHHDWRLGEVHCVRIAANRPESDYDGAMGAKVCRSCGRRSLLIIDEHDAEWGCYFNPDGSRVV